MSSITHPWKFKHGHGGGTKETRSSTYVSWNNMKNRCKNPSSPSFSLYGGAGITVCERWMFFENFLADMGERPDGTSIDRLDSSLGYFKENCRWSTPTEQCSHLPNARRILFDGEVIPLAELSRRTGLPQKTLAYRLDNHWDADALITPPTFVPSNAKRVLFDGAERTLSEISELTGVPHKTLAYRLAANWSIELLAAPVGQPNPNKRKIKYDGKEYGLKEISRLTGIARTTFSRKLNSGMSVDEIVAEKVI